MKIHLPDSFGSLEEANEYIAKEMFRQNNAARPDFEGYSPFEMHQLLYFPFGKESPLQVKSVTQDLAQQLWVFQIALKILGAANQPQGVKLTASGYLPVALIKEITATGCVREEGVLSGWQKINKESDSEWITVAHNLLDIAGIVKKRQNVLSVTAAGKAIMLTPDSLFIKLLETCILRFNWGVFDLYESENIGPVGAGFTLLILLKYGQVKRPASFYAEKYLKAFPNLKSEGNARTCYIIRTFSRFFNAFGLVELDSKVSFDSNPFVLASPALRNIFSLRPHRIIDSGPFGRTN